MVDIDEESEGGSVAVSLDLTPASLPPPPPISLPSPPRNIRLSDGSEQVSNGMLTEHSEGHTRLTPIRRQLATTRRLELGFDGTTTESGL